MSSSRPLFDGDVIGSDDSSLSGQRRYAGFDPFQQLKGRTREEIDQIVTKMVERFTAMEEGRHTQTMGSESPCDSGVSSSLDLYPPPPPLPVLPDWSRDLPTRLRQLQSFIRSFEYNHLGHEFHPISKLRCFSRVMSQVREMIREAMPIKCLEAVAMATFITREWKEIERLPLRFKTRSGGHTYWHIVLCVTNGEKYGTVGLSRRCTLDYRPMNYPSLSALVDSFRDSYEEVDHEVHMITVGLPLPRREHAPDRICWHFLQIPILQGSTPHTHFSSDGATVKREWSIAVEILDRFSKLAVKLADLVRKVVPPPTTHTIPQAMFIPPAAIKAIGPIHTLVTYDSSLGALVYHPEWRTVLKAVGHTGGGVSHDSESDSDESDIDDTDGPHSGTTKKQSEESKTSLPHSPLPLPSVSSQPSGTKSAAAIRRARERQDRRRAKVLVQLLRDRYRPPPHIPSAQSAAGASPLAKRKPAGSPSRPSPINTQALSTNANQPTSPPPSNAHTKKYATGSVAAGAGRLRSSTTIGPPAMPPLTARRQSSNQPVSHSKARTSFTRTETPSPPSTSSSDTSPISERPTTTPAASATITNLDIQSTLSAAPLIDPATVLLFPPRPHHSRHSSRTSVLRSKGSIDVFATALRTALPDWERELIEEEAMRAAIEELDQREGLDISNENIGN